MILRTSLYAPHLTKLGSTEGYMTGKTQQHVQLELVAGAIVSTLRVRVGRDFETPAGVC